VKTLTAAALVLGFVAQAGTPSPREVLELSRPLTGAEVEIVLAASRKALAARTLRLGRVVSAYDFEYRRANVRPPPGVRAPDCIQSPPVR
jgi:hypothetical protein